MKNKVVALIQEGKDLVICEFSTDHDNSDYDVLDDARFHFEERVSSAKDHAKFVMVDYFEKAIEDFRIIELVDLSE